MLIINRYKRYIVQTIPSANRTVSRLADLFILNFTDYLEAVQKEVSEDLGSVEGELTSQETDGCSHTLANSQHLLGVTL